MNKFAIVPNEALLDPELTPSEFRVLVALYSFRDKNADTVWPKTESLAERARIKDTTQISKVTTRLERKGWLTKASKMGFHGPKRYVMTIPDRLIPLDGGDDDQDETSQVGKFSQVGESDQSKDCQVGKSSQVGEIAHEDCPQGEVTAPKLANSPKLDGTAITNLERTTSSQLGKNYQDYKEHTSRNIPMNSSEPNGSAASAGQAVDKSILTAYEKYYDSPDQDDPDKPNLFSVGVRMLAKANISEDRARKTLGKMQSEFKKGPVLDALLESLIYRPSEPIGYLYGILQAKRTMLPNEWSPGENAVSELMGLGMTASGLKQAEGFFRFWMLEREATSADWSEYFKRWCIQDMERAEFDQGRQLAWLARAGGFREQFVEPPGGTL